MEFVRTNILFLLGVIFLAALVAGTSSLDNIRGEESTASAAPSNVLQPQTAAAPTTTAPAAVPAAAVSASATPATPAPARRVYHEEEDDD